ncbi:uromodulin-like 1 [Lethenteron reissneri]|uniref:uromodulin-like 1 n=1 Tax=Lethenteron reissneri TaxID=7753 RepID=UPI002AB692FC|nr:uromodulin-like 1 [Lethenteron reissneri]
MAFVTRVAKCVCIFVTIVLGASEVASAASMRPLRGYHLCRGEVLVNRSAMESYTESFAKLSLCQNGWLAHVCYKTGYRVAYRPVVHTQLENATVCCAGYERSGSYCVLPLNESSVFTSKPGGCPASPPGGSTAPCAGDGDCGNATKCCPDAGGGGGQRTCAPPVPQANTGYYDIELTTTIEYSADLLDPHSASFLEAARLVHSMVSGLLESWNATGIYVTAFAPCTLGFWRSTEAKLRVAFSPPRTDRLALGMKLQKLPFTAPRVMFARVTDVNECNAPELNSCQSGTNCINRIGTYECRGNPVVAPTTSEPHSSGSPPWNSSSSSPSPSAPYPPPTTPCGPDPLAPPYAVVTGLNAMSFGLSWDAGWTQQQRQQQLQQSYELRLSEAQSQGLEPTTLYSQEPRYNFTGLRPGVVYTVAITSRSCGKNSSALVQRVKTDSQELVGSVRVINRNFTDAMANTSSEEFANFSRELIAEILAGLPPNVAALVANGLLTIKVKELNRGSIVAVIDLILGGSLTGLTFDQVLLALTQALVNSTGLQFDLAGFNVTDTNECANSTLNDCAENATCTNTQGSYNCTCNVGFTDPSSIVAGRTCLVNTNPQPSSTVAPGGSTIQPNVTAAASSINSTVPGATTQPNVTAVDSLMNATVPGATTQPNNITTPASSVNSTVPGATTQPNNITTPASSVNSTVPGATTQPNNVTTPASGVNSTVPGATTQPNNVTTPASGVNSTVPGATTQPNNVTTPASSVNSTVPGATTQPNNVTTPASGFNSTVPGATTQPKNVTTPASGVNSTVPGATTQPNNFTTPASGVNSTVPGATTQPNNVTTPASGVNSTVPSATTQRNNNATTAAAGSNSTVPSATTQRNNVTTPASGVNSTVPSATTQRNNNVTTAAAGSNSTVPSATTQRNNVTTPASGVNSTVPSATTQRNSNATTPASGVNSTVPGATTQPNNNVTTPASGVNSTVPGATTKPNNNATTTTATQAAGGNNTTVTATTTIANATTTTTAPASASNASLTAVPHPQSTLPTAFPASALTVTCDGSYLYVRMPKAKLALWGVQQSDVYLGLQSCGAQQGATSDSLEFKSAWSNCGTKVSSNITHTLLTNTLKSGTAVGDPSLLSIAVFCALSNNVNTSTGFPVSGGFVINDTVYGTGWYSVSLQMWQNDSSLSTAPVLGANDKLVIKVNIASANPNITAVMQTCWATPGPSQTDAQRTELIANKCATTNTDLKIIESGTSSTASFELTLYKYVNYTMTYIHCSIGICLTTVQNCKPVCSGSSRSSYIRSERESSPNDNVIDMGPIYYKAATTSATATEPTTGTEITPWRIATIVLGVLLGAALLILLAIAAYRAASRMHTARYGIEERNNPARASANAITNRNYRVL